MAVTGGSAPGTAISTFGAWRPILLLAVGVVLRFAFHALFVPPYEGPDEPAHLGRVWSFAEEPLAIALRGAELSGVINAGLLARPCNAGLHATLGCPEFGREKASFGLLRPLPELPPIAATSNPESNQPPLFYLAAGLLVRVLQRLRGSPRLSPEEQLLTVRLLCVALVAVAIFGPLRAIASRRSAGFAVTGLILLALPGASESLARCSNDAAVFLWAACTMAAIDSAPHPRRLALLMGVGPLLKLTAIPLVVVMFVVLWRRGSRRSAVLGALLASLAMPLQLLRGWGWGGTLELNRATPAFSEPLTVTLVGLARSAYTFVKTAFWLGEWSVFHPPVVLLAAGAGLALLWVASARWQGGSDLALAYLVGGLSALLGCALFALAVRKYWGSWAGIGGWHLWSWFPWLAVAAGDLLRVNARWRSALIGATAVFCIVSNTVYYQVASRIYG